MTPGQRVTLRTARLTASYSATRKLWTSPTMSDARTRSRQIWTSALSTSASTSAKTQVKKVFRALKFDLETLTIKEKTGFFRHILARRRTNFFCRPWPHHLVQGSENVHPAKGIEYILCIFCKAGLNTRYLTQLIADTFLDL